MSESLERAYWESDLQNGDLERDEGSYGRMVRFEEEHFRDVQSDQEWDRQNAPSSIKKGDY